MNVLQKTPVAAALAMLCCVLWGSAFPCVKIGYELFGIENSSPQSQILFAGMRFAIAGVMVIIAGSIIQKKPLLPKMRQIPKVLMLSLFQTVLQYIFFYIGLSNTSGVKSSVIEGSNVFICILISALIFRLEKLTAAKIIGCVLGMAGIVVINLDSSLLSGMSLTGEGFIFISIIAYSLSSVLMKKLSADNDPVMMSGWQFLFGGIAMMAGGFAFGGRAGISSEVSTECVLMLLYLAFISACAYTVWGILLKYNPVSKITIFGFMNPVCGVILSALLLGETQQAMRFESVIALVLIAAGIYIVNRKKAGE